jgi:hypothetical protein
VVVHHPFDIASPLMPKKKSAIPPWMQQKTTKLQSQQSFHLMPAASKWQGNVRCSLHIASDHGHPSHLVWGNLTAQCTIFALCCNFIGDRFRVQVLCCSALVLWCLQLRFFAKLPPTVSGILLGKILDLWLYLEEDSGRYFLATRTWVIDKSQRRYIRNSLPKDIKIKSMSGSGGGFL